MRRTALKILQRRKSPGVFWRLPKRSVRQALLPTMKGLSKYVKSIQDPEDGFYSIPFLKTGKTLRALRIIPQRCYGLMVFQELVSYLPFTQKFSLCSSLADVDPGKTVIASLIIEELKAIDSVEVCFFYCKYSDDRKNSFANVLRGILVQLVQKNEELLSYVYDACCSSSELTMDAPTRLKDLVKTSLRSCSNTCIIIDGIDECEEVEEKKTIEWFLSMVEDITKDNAGTTRLLFISQRDKLTESLLAQASVIPLDSQYHQEDIQTYAHHWSVKIQRKFGIPENSAIQIGTAVAAQAEGERNTRHKMAKIFRRKYI